MVIGNVEQYEAPYIHHADAVNDTYYPSFVT